MDGGVDWWKDGKGEMVEEWKGEGIRREGMKEECGWRDGRVYWWMWEREGGGGYVGVRVNEVTMEWKEGEWVMKEEMVGNKRKVHKIFQ